MKEKMRAPLQTQEKNSTAKEAVVGKTVSKTRTVPTLSEQSMRLHMLMCTSESSSLSSWQQAWCK